MCHTTRISEGLSIVLIQMLQIKALSPGYKIIDSNPGTGKLSCVVYIA